MSLSPALSTLILGKSCLTVGRLGLGRLFWILAACWALPLTAQGQTDTLFWFVAPEISSGQGDSPVRLHLSAGPSGATVTVDQPANGVAFPPISLSVPPNAVLVHDLSARQSNLENQPADLVLPYGLRIRSSHPVGVLYEVRAPQNAAVFTLKGRTALGLRFVVGGQASLAAWGNDPLVSPPARSRFDLVASSDSTLVTITPRNAVTGHAAGTPFQRLLMRGQTYSVVATGTSGTGKVTGSLVQSDKPIAVTYADDAVVDFSYGDCRDLIGDQLVPVASVGKDYIVARGRLNNQGGINPLADRYYVTATDTGTRILINGILIHTFTSVGETYPLSVNNPFEYLQTNKPVYIFHVTGMGCEVGGALLPRIQCTGSRVARFNRNAEDSLYLLVLVEDGGQSLFTVNGNASTLTAADFTPIPGNPWRVARKNLSQALGPGSGTVSIQNSSYNFHAGLIAGSPDWDAPASNAVQYAYFSDYGLSSNRDLYDTICQGEVSAVGNQLFDRSGIYVVPFSATTLCDSTVTLYLTVYPKDTMNLTPVPVRACSSYRINGRNITVSGLYTDSLLNRWGCDSLSRIQLTVDPVYNQNLARTSCDSFFFDNRWIFQSGTYRDTLLSQFGCDSIVRLQLTVGRSYQVTELVENCGPYRWRGQTYPNSGTFTLLITGPGGCDSLLTLDLTVKPKPEAVWSGPTSWCLEDGPLLLDRGSPAGGRFEGSGIRPQGSEWIFEPTLLQTYDLLYIVTHPQGCSDTAAWRMRVHDECSGFLYLPNAFAPEDATNEANRVFGMTAYHVTKVKVRIYDRYGQVIFESTDLNFGWDGKVKSQPAPSGTYFYQLEYENAAGNKGQRYGPLHLVR